MSSRLRLTVAAIVVMMASGAALACSDAKMGSADGSSRPSPTQEQRGG